MFAGPIIAREILTAPRPTRYYISRAAYIGLLFILMWTAWQSIIGWEDVRDVGLIARFGRLLFQFFVYIQLTLMLFHASLSAATAIAHEKDRRTFVLLLMTDLSDVEIILGKLTASLLQVLTLLAAGAPVFFICLLLGGTSETQVLEILGITAGAGVLAGSIGLIVALWRDRTFQSLALTVLAIALGLCIVELAGYLAPNFRIAGLTLAQAMNPYRTVIAVLNPTLGAGAKAGVVFVSLALGLTILLNSVSVLMLRVWNPGRNEPREDREENPDEVGSEAIESIGEEALAGPGATTSTGLRVPRCAHRRISKAAGSYRAPWTNPILWREFMTRAYGTKPLIVKGAYLLVFALAVALYYFNPLYSTSEWRPAFSLIPVTVLSLLLINAQGVTSLTSERDTGSLDLLLVTELAPQQFIFGKLHGVMYNTKEMILAPLLMTLGFVLTGAISTEVGLCFAIDFVLLVHFSAMLGIHSAISFTNSRAAVANSLGTIFFLMVGIGICAWLIILGDQQFSRQLLSFMIFIGAGSVALFASMGSKNPSQAIALVALLTPFWTFYCVISLINSQTMATFLVSFLIYCFGLMAMLIPAVSDFDIALGRTSAIQG